MKLNYKLLINMMIASLIVALSMRFIQRRKPTKISTGGEYLDYPEDKVNILFENLNYQKSLSFGVKNATNEVIALQALINDYLGRNALELTGNFDSNTRYYLRGITGKYASSLFEFIYLYYVPVFSEPEAIEVLKSLN